MQALHIESVSKRFGGVVAAEDLNLVVQPGKITGLIGPNGAGKTTLINLITGMMALTSGIIRLGDTDLTRLSADRVGRLGIARTFQNIRLQKEETTLRNVLIGFHRHETSSLFAATLGLPSSRNETAHYEREAYALLDRFGMREHARKLAQSLPYGHQRRVEIMRALASSPGLLLLDEPVAGMNDIEANELGEIIRELAGSGMAILLIEHNIRFVTSLCSHVYVLDHGKIIAEGTPGEVMSNSAVISAYLGQVA